jgi:hypothetical protein
MKLFMVFILGLMIGVLSTAAYYEWQKEYGDEQYSSD